jgi:hypothetical protein
MTPESTAETPPAPVAVPAGGLSVVRRRLLIGGTLLTTFVCGGIVGAVTALAVHHRHHGPGFGPGDDAPQRMLTMLEKKLSLDSRQSEAVGKILREHWALMMKYREEDFARIEASCVKMSEDVAAELNPEQQKIWEQHEKERPRFPGGGPRGAHHRGGGPGPFHGDQGPHGERRGPPPPSG